MLLPGCTRVVTGAAEMPPTPVTGALLPTGVDVDRIVLDVDQMRAITGAGLNLSIIPTMDTKYPVDIDSLAATVPPVCRFVYAETAVFGRDYTQFHKTTFQYPPKRALISEAAVAYLDDGASRRVFDALVDTVVACSGTSAGRKLIGAWDAGPESLRSRAGRCGAEYRLESAVLLAVTFCGFTESIAELVLTNMAGNVPG